MGAVGLWGVVIIVALIVLLYGAKRLPDMARSLGRSSREFKDALAEAPEEFRDGMSKDAARELEPAEQPGSSSNKSSRQSASGVARVPQPPLSDQSRVRGLRSCIQRWRLGRSPPANAAHVNTRFNLCRRLTTPGSRAVS